MEDQSVSNQTCTATTDYDLTITETTTEFTPDTTEYATTEEGSRYHTTCCCGRSNRLIISDAIIDGIRKLFYKWGLFVSTYPWHVILISLVVVAIFVPGIIAFFHRENDSHKLWVPQHSQATKDKEWVDAHFPPTTRSAEVIVEHDNVLSTGALNAILDLHVEITSAGKQQAWSDLCARRGPQCWTTSLLEFWSFDEKVIRKLTEEEIVDKVNSISISPVFFDQIRLEKYLGNIKTSYSGRIIGASATKMSYKIKANGTIAQYLTAETIKWEQEFSATLNGGHTNLRNVFHHTETTSRDENSFIFGDVGVLIATYFIVFAFVALASGKCNCVHNRIYLTLAGMLCVVLSIIFSFGLCSYIGFAYGPLHGVLPFLLLGIGMEGMFIIVQALDQISENEKTNESPLQERLALCVEKAGVSLTITSLTDMAALGIGAATALPAVKSFCLYAFFGVLATYLLLVTFFVACVSVDESRALARRDACCCCISHQDGWQPNKWSKLLLTQMVVDKLCGPSLIKLPVKIVIVVVTVLLFLVCIWGLCCLKHESDPVWFLPPGEPSYQYLTAEQKYFQSDGRYTAIYLGEFSYFKMSWWLDKLHKAAVTDPYTAEGTLSSWFVSFKQWLVAVNDTQVTQLLTKDRSPRTEADMITLLKAFLVDPLRTGSIFTDNVKFDPTMTRITASKIQLRHRPLNDSRESVAAMESLRGLCGDFGFPHSQCFAYSKYYGNFEADKALEVEVPRNLSLACVCIFIVVLLLLADFWVCMFLSVALLQALIGVGGVLYFSGLTLNAVTATLLIVAVGRLVDSAAQVGHCFLVERGTRNERTVKTLGCVGPAVLSGAFSTFLAFVLLASLQSYIFHAFFKVFLGVVILGLFQGLVFLPVLLSWLGPAPYFTINYPPSVIDKAVNFINANTCREKIPKIRTHGALTKVRSAFTAFQMRFGRDSDNRESAFSNGNISYCEGSNYIVTNGMVVQKVGDNRTSTGQVSSGLPSTLGGHDTKVDVQPEPIQCATENSVIHMPMSDFLNVQFRKADVPKDQSRDEPDGLGQSWERTVQRFPHKVIKQTAWLPSYKNPVSSE